MRILVHGAGGHMGRIISGMAAEGRCGAELIARVSPELQADPEEVSETRWVSFDALKAEMLEYPERFSSWFIIAAPQVMRAENAV